MGFLSCAKHHNLIEAGGFRVKAAKPHLDKINPNKGVDQTYKVHHDVCLANCYGELILPVIALRKWAESHFGDAPNRSETTGPAKHAPMEKHRMISWKSCRG